MINPSTLKPFGKFCVTLGMLPSSYKASLTYEEQLLWFCNYLETKVIPAINTNAEALQEVQALYEEMRQFMIDYFAHLDVQEEIDNKLDEMVEDGTFEEILEEYFADIKNDINFLNKLHNFQSNNIKWIAHRGASLEAPENTVPAFQWASNQFFDCIETDVQATSDNWLYCLHDDSVDRMTDGSGAISSMTHTQVDNLTIDAGNNISLYPNLKIPTFGEFLRTVKKLGIFPVIEIKFANNDTLINEFLSGLKQNGLLYNCIIISFNTSILEKLRTIDKNLKIAPILELSRNNLDYCIEHNFGIDFRYDTSISYEDGYALVKYAHENNMFVMAWNYSSMLNQNPINWGCDYITCDNIMFTNSGSYLSDFCYSKVNGMKASNKYVEKLMLANDIVPYTTNTNFTNFYERYQPFSYNNVFRVMLFDKIRIKQGSIIHYNIPTGYKMSIVPFDKDDVLIQDTGWASTENTSYTCNFANGAYAIILLSRTDDKELTHADFDKLRNVFMGCEY